MKVLGVVCFVVGVAALATLVIRRGRDTPTQWPDYILMFIGPAGAIAGIALIFQRGL